MELEIEEIKKIIPHRYPFLFVDRVISMVPGEEIEAIKNVTINEPFFQGHFPENPVMPGVLIVEGMAQTAAILGISKMNREGEEKALYLTGLDKVRFRSPVKPGDTIRYRVKFISKKWTVWKLEAEAYVGDKKVVEGEIIAGLADKIMTGQST